MFTSFFRRPVRTLRPCRQASVLDLWRYLRSAYARLTTSTLRSLPPEERRAYKQANFDFCTPGGVFTQRKRDGLASYSGFLVMDIDHVSDPSRLLQKAIYDWQPSLAFVSPSGEGCKMFISIAYDLQNLTGCAPNTPLSPEEAKRVSDTYTSLFQRLREAWNSYAPSAPLDPSGADISRTCYLPCDPLAFISSDLLQWTH